MKHRSWFYFTVFSCCVTSLSAAHAVDCNATSRKLLDNLDHENYAAAGADFNNKMKTLSAERLQQIWQMLPEKMGARGGREEARVVQINGNEAVITPLHFGHTIANAVVACSTDGKIDGFRIGPAQ